MTRARRVFALAIVLVLGASALALTPTASADPACTPYTGSGQTKSRACADPTSSRCVFWSEGWVGSSPFYVCWVPASV